MEELTPITRREVFLAKASGQEVETPTPVTREEVFLDAIVKGGGSSLPSTETASAGDVLSLDENKESQWATPSGGGVLVAHWDYDNDTLDKTWQEIHDADCVVITTDDGTRYFVISVQNFEGEYNVVSYDFPSSSLIGFVASSASGYPVYANA